MCGVIGINFVDHFLNQGAPAEHKSAETPIGHESNTSDSSQKEGKLEIFEFSNRLGLVKLMKIRKFSFFFRLHFSLSIKV